MRVFLSFLGLGTTKRDPFGEVSDATYKESRYRLATGAVSQPTPYVQAALLEHLTAQGQPPDLVLLAMTPGSRRWHWEKEGRLGTVLRHCQTKGELGEILEIDISESLDVASQWATFEQLLSKIPPRSQLFVDMTHGFRLIPILFSSAIHFLVQTRNIELSGVYYGAFDASQQDETPIVDMKDFYAINLWAEAVQRLLQDANPDAIAELASKPTSLKLQNLEDAELVEALRHLSAVLKNTDAPHVAEAASRVILRAQQLGEGASPAATVLLQMILEKFGSLALGGGGKRFAPAWYQVQLSMARVLLDHGLLMQGLTVLRELVVSWGEELALHAMALPDNPGRQIYLQKRKYKDFKDGWFKQARHRAAEPFFARLHIKADQWRAEQGDHDPDGTILRGVMDGFFSAHFGEESARGSFAFLTELGKLRNSFNHAWTDKKKADHDAIKAKALEHFDHIQRWTAQLLEAGVIGRGEATLQTSPSSAPASSPCFLNLSNHPISTWSAEQTEAARALGLGEPADLQDGMPLVPPEIGPDEVDAMAGWVLERALKQHPRGAHVAGEFTLTHALVERLQALGIPCFVATTRREVESEPQPDGPPVKRATFRFVRWRAYVSR